MNIRTISIIVLFLALAGGAGFYIWRDVSMINNQPGANSGQSSEPQAIDLSDIGPEGKTIGGATIKTIPNPPPLPPAPSLSRPLIFPASFPPEAQKSFSDKVAMIIANLKKNMSSTQDWLELGIQWNMINDHEGAGLAWEYASLLSPAGYVPFYNLGGLYGYYLHDNTKAEANYTKAIANGPDQIYIWRDVYEFYRNVLKDDEKARQTLEAGIAKNPETSKDLKYLLEHFNEL